MAQPSKKEMDEVKKAVATPYTKLTRRNYKVRDPMDERYGIIGVALNRGEDDLDKILREQQKLKAQNLRNLQVKKLELEMQKEVAALEKTLGAGGAAGPINPQELAHITAAIAQLPEDQRPIAIQALGAFRQTGGDTMGSLGPLLMVSMLQQKPQSNMTELVSALKGLNDITKGQQPTGDNTALVLQVSKMLGEAKDAAYQMQIQLLNNKIEDLEPHDPLAYQKQLIDIAQGLGFKPGTGETNIELEKVKLEHQNMLQKSSQEFQLLLRKMERDDDRWEAIIKTLAPAVNSLSGATATRIQNPMGAQARTPLVCPNCGFSPIWISPSNPVENCPQCSTPVTSQQYAHLLQRGPQPPGPSSPGMPPDEGPSPPGSPGD